MELSVTLRKKLKRLDPKCDNFIGKNSKTILECVNKFAFLTTVQIQKNSNDWLTNEIKRVILKSDNLFDLLVQSPCENSKNLFKRQRNLVTSLIRNAKRECNYRKLGNNPSSKTINSELKYQLTELKIPYQTM